MIRVGCLWVGALVTVLLMGSCGPDTELEDPEDVGEFRSLAGGAEEAGHGESLAAMDRWTSKETFGPTRNLSGTPADSTFPRVEVSGNHVYVVWLDQSTGNGDVYFRESDDRGRTFGRIRNLSVSDANAESFSLAKAGRRVYVVWTEGGIRFRASDDFGETFGPVKTLSEAGGATRIAAVGSHVYVAWLQGGEETGDVLFRASHDGGRTFDETLDISEEENFGQMELAAAESQVYVVWVTDEVLLRRSTNHGRSFRRTQILTRDPVGPGSVRVAAQENDVYVVWQDSPDPSTPEDDIFFRRSTNAGASFGDIENLSRTPGDSLEPELDVQDGNVYVAWEDNTPGNGDIFFRRSRNRGRTFSSTRNLSESPVDSFDHQISSAGSFVRVVWLEFLPGNREIFYRSSSNHGSSFGDVLNLSRNPGASEFPAIISSGGGDEVHVVWQDSTPGLPEIFYRRGERCD